MANGQASAVLRHLRRLVGPEGGAEPSDGELLERFAARREEEAFAALVRRHGPLVLGVCERVLHDRHDAEDAFQATFLVLIRRAASLVRSGSLAGWLYTVAYHTALRARAAAARRRVRERQVPDMPSAEPTGAAAWRELGPLLDAEVHRLPAKYREPFVLCCLQGHTRPQAARRLGCPVGTVKSRLARARDLLRGRLTRRGLTLSAGALAAVLAERAAAAVPAHLFDVTLSNGLRYAAGTAAGPAALAEEVLKTMVLSKVKAAGLSVLTLGLLALGAWAFTHRALAQKPDPAPAAGKPVRIRLAAQPPAPPPAPAPRQEAPKTAVAGRVIDEAGRPLAGAEVAAVAVWAPRRPGQAYRQEVLARGKTDAKGRFRLEGPAAAPDQFWHVHVLARAKGFGFGWAVVPVQGHTPKLAVCLAPKAVARGALVDLQGLPAAGVKGRVVQVTPGAGTRPKKMPGVMEQRMMALEASFRRQRGFSFENAPAPKDLALWPRTVTTDAKGRFQLDGFGKGQHVTLLIEDDRFATQRVEVEVGGRPLALALAPPQKVEGEVVAEDTGKPIPGAWLSISGYRRPPVAFTPYQGGVVVARTDARGRFATNPYPGENYALEVFPPEGAPFLAVGRQFPWVKGAARRQLKIALPRAIELRGKVLDRTTGKPVHLAKLFFEPQREGNPLRRNDLLPAAYYPAYSRDDGTFRLRIPQGPGHLLCDAPGGDFLSQAVGANELFAGKPGGGRRYFSAVVALNLKAGDKPVQVTVAVRRGVTLRGKVVGPDGKRVPHVVMICPGELLRPQTGSYVTFPPGPTDGLQSVVTRDGRFELPGADPDKTYRVLIYDLPADASPSGWGPVRVAMDQPQAIRFHAWGGPFPPSGKSRLGAVAELKAARSGQPVTVKLAPLGAARVRFTDAKGKAVRPFAWLEVVVTPAHGPGKGALNPEVMTVATLNNWRPVPAPIRVDDDDRLTFPGLIAGATYRLKLMGPQFDQVQAEKRFTGPAGGVTVRLPDIVVKHTPKQ